jgi:hypothetical protein
MRKFYHEAIYPAYRPTALSAEERSAYNAAALISDSSDSQAIYYAARRCGVQPPPPNRSARVTRRRHTPSEQIVTVRASAAFFAVSDAWFERARPWDSDFLISLDLPKPHPLPHEKEPLCPANK